MVEAEGLRGAAWWQSYWSNFLGEAPVWYKQTIVAFLIVNPAIYFGLGGFIAGWVLVLEFIFTLAMALRCYPLQPGGLLAIEAILLGMTSTHHVGEEVLANWEVILLLVFMVAGIYFMKDLLLFIFTKILLGVRSKVVLSLMFCFVAAFLSAFLDALTVTAVIISVAVGFYRVYHGVATTAADIDTEVPDVHQESMTQFRAFLRSLVMHGAVGTALGGVMTIVGEPQNVLIAGRMGWEFMEFFLQMLPVTLPVLFVGLITCVALESFKVAGYGPTIPNAVLVILTDFDGRQSASRTREQRAKLVVQAICGVLLMFALGFHVAEIGLIGLSLIVLLTAFGGVVQEHHIGPAFEEALPFTALLCVFFGIVAVIAEQQLFQPVIDYVLALPPSQQPGVFYIANGLLSMISDNVFVATVYIGQVEDAFNSGMIDRRQFELLAVAINTGTNIPSVATPNGQAAFLFLLTSSLAPLIRLSYGRMVVMALPYMVTMGVTGWIGVMWLL